jgi:PTEN induced putative kinase 1
VSLPAELSGLAGQVGEVRQVPAHPNIVEMLTVFADQVPGLPGDRQLYGDALPARLNPDGYGRNMSLFLVMRQYDCCLRDYLHQYRDQLSSRTCLILFTQLLEGTC